MFYLIPSVKVAPSRNDGWGYGGRLGLRTVDWVVLGVGELRGDGVIIGWDVGWGVDRTRRG